MKKSVPHSAQKEGRKVKGKGSKATRQLFEAIAEKLLQECTTNSNQKLETFCTELINKKCAEIRQEVSLIESGLSTRISEVERKVVEFSDKLSGISVDTAKQNAFLKDDIAKVSRDAKDLVESERQKRLAATKKAQTLSETAMEQCKSLVNNASKESLGAISSLNEDFRIQAKEIARLRENFDDALIKRHGSVRGDDNKASKENLSNTFHHQQGLDAGLVLDNLAQRIRHLETQLASEDDLLDPPLMDSSFQHQHGLGGMNGRIHGSPVRSLAGGTSHLGYGGGGGGGATVGRKLAAQKFRRLEESIYDLRAQLQACEADIHEVKSTVVSKLRSVAASGLGGGNSPLRGAMMGGLHSYDDHHLHSNNGSAAEIRTLQKKVKKLAENTSRACRSLSTSLTDVQQATLNLYTWTDTAYDAFGKVSHELGLKGNVCSRARVYQPAHSALSTHDMFSD